MEYPKGLGRIQPFDENQDEVVAYFAAPPKKKKYPAKWLLLWQDPSEIGVSIMEQAKSQSMTLSDYRVRDFLLGTIGIGNYVFVNQSEVARELKIHRITVVESIKRLCSMNILLKGPKSGRSNTYMVNPAFCFSGGLGSGIKERKETINAHKAKILPFEQQASLLD